MASRPFQPAGQFMARVLVAPAARQQGLGSTMLGVAERFVREHGGDACYTHIKDDDPASRAYAEKRYLEMKRNLAGEKG